MSSESRNGKPSCRIEINEGRPVIRWAERLVSPAAYCEVHYYWGVEKWQELHREFARRGVHTFYLQPLRMQEGYRTTRFWTDDGVYPEPSPEDPGFTLDRQAQEILKIDPDARFYVRFNTEVPEKWAEQHSDHLQTLSSGSTELGRHGCQASWASDLYLAGLETFLHRMIGYCESRPWAERVLGYMAFPIGEGTSLLSVNGHLFDRSPVMQVKFREWLREKYATVQALREAWGDESVDFNTVQVPTDFEWVEKRKNLLHWPEPRELARERDYLLLHKDLLFRWVRLIMRSMREAIEGRRVLLGIDALKQPLQGWQHNDAFYAAGVGPGYPHMLAASGSLGVGPLLDDENLDVIITPADYHGRAVGYGYESEGIADSLVIRGKTIFIENDLRTWVGRCRQDQGAFLTPKEARAGLFRSAASALSRGHHYYWMTVACLFYDDPKLQDIIGEECRLLDASAHWPHRETEHAIAMIIDDESALYEDFTSGYQNLAVLWQRVEGLSHCGIPYRIFLLSDLERDGMPPYRCYLFPNLFKVDERVIELLRNKVLRDGRTAIFGPATGITDGRRISAEGARELLGIDLELIERSPSRRVVVRHYGHPITRRLPASMTYGDTLTYGPLLVPTETACEAEGVSSLGQATVFWEVNRPGLVVREFGRGAVGSGKPGLRGEGDCAVVFSVAVPLPAALLREVARYGGCNVWCEEDDCVYGSGTVAGIHSVKAGPRMLRLPEPVTVWDAVSREKLAENASEIEMDIDPPETRIFYLGEEMP